MRFMPFIPLRGQTQERVGDVHVRRIRSGTLPLKRNHFRRSRTGRHNVVAGGELTACNSPCETFMPVERIVIVEASAHDGGGRSYDTACDVLTSGDRVRL